MQLIAGGVFLICHGTQTNARFIHDLTKEEWGEESDNFLLSIKAQSFKRHHQIAKKSAFLTK